MEKRLSYLESRNVQVCPNIYSVDTLNSLGPYPTGAVRTVSPNKKKLGELLIEAGITTENIVQQTIQEQKTRKKKLGELLTEKGICRERDAAAALSIQLGMRCVDLRLMSVESAAVELVPETLARKHLIMPLRVDSTTLYVAMADPLSLEALEDIQFASGLRISPSISTPSDIHWAISNHYRADQSVASIMNDIRSENTIEILKNTSEEQPDGGDIRKQSEAAPIVKIVNLIISEAVQNRASDIHVEPLKDKLVVRNRVDGLLRLTSELPRWVHGAIASRIKIMAEMDISEKRLPQDGRITVKVSETMLDLRVSTLPTHFGEKVVIRILDPRNRLVSLEHLGLGGKNLTDFLSLLSKSQGIILVTGPTGSGKTTTLYAALSRINQVKSNIVTIEEPIEYELDGINQVGVNEKVGRTFSMILRSVLRQDPDVIMVGEMRDIDTATTAMQASLTGHLVLSTIHTNNTVATIARMRNLGIPSYLIASTISGIVAQRLVRVICPYCKTKDTPNPEDLRKLGLAHLEAKDLDFYQGHGCAQCGGTGFRGIQGIFEILVLSQRIRENITAEATEATIKQLALAEGMQTLAQAGVEKVLKGITSVEEVRRVIQADEEFGAICTNCGYVLSSEFVACPQCGRKVIETCQDCNRMIDPQWKFCPYCSTKITYSNPILRCKKASGN